jgi:hypothetical protein
MLGHRRIAARALLVITPLASLGLVSLTPDDALA